MSNGGDVLVLTPNDIAGPATVSALRTFIEKEKNSGNVFHFFCPYRVCPLGAHVDHQLGLVTGFAIDKGTKFSFFATEDCEIEVYSENTNIVNNRFEINRVYRVSNGMVTCVNEEIDNKNKQPEMEES